MNMAATDSSVVPGLSALFVVCLIAAIVPILTHLLPDRPPQVVLLLLGGIVVGPYVLDLVDPSKIQLLADLGLGFLFLLAGYEIEPRVLRGALGRRALACWVISLVAAVTTVLVLEATGFIAAPIPIAIALTTTALGTLLPILQDRGLAHGGLADAVTASGAFGELLPILAIALVLGAYSSWLEVLAVLLISTLGWSLTAIGRRARGTSLERIISAAQHGTAQVTLRWTLVVLLGLLLLTSRFGIDSVLGAFLAGFVLRHWAGEDEDHVFVRKLESVGYGLFIPLFFVVSGMNLDVDAVVREPVRLTVFLGLILLIRGLPHFFVFRGLLGRFERLQLVFLCSTTLPLLVALTEIGVREGHMHPANASALVGAGMVSVALCPFVALRLLGPRAAREAERLAQNESGPRDVPSGSLP
jgi:Kef-type K+ transport system membrane component KefB